MFCCYENTVNVLIPSYFYWCYENTVERRNPNCSDFGQVTSVPFPNGSVFRQRLKIRQKHSVFGHFWASENQTKPVPNQFHLIYRIFQIQNWFQTGLEPVWHCICRMQNQFGTGFIQFSDVLSYFWAKPNVRFLDILSYLFKNQKFGFQTDLMEILRPKRLRSERAENRHCKNLDFGALL